MFLMRVGRFSLKGSWERREKAGRGEWHITFNRHHKDGRPTWLKHFLHNFDPILAEKWSGYFDLVTFFYISTSQPETSNTNKIPLILRSTMWREHGDNNSVVFPGDQNADHARHCFTTTACEWKQMFYALWHKDYHQNYYQYYCFCYYYYNLVPSAGFSKRDCQKHFLKFKNYYL